MYQCAIMAQQSAEWVDVRVTIPRAVLTSQLPFSDFVLTRAGVVIDVFQVFDPSKIEMVGLSLADKCEGPFALQIRSIRAYRGGQRSAKEEIAESMNK